MSSKKIALILALTVAGARAGATTVSPLEGAFFESAKIYVVVAVAVLILGGIFAYLIALERKLKKLENEVNQRNTAK